MAAVVSGVTETLLGLTFLPDSEDRPWQELLWRAAVLSIGGGRPVTVGLSSDEYGCTALSAAMFQVSANEVNEEMRSDSLCELVNMTAGLIKEHLRLDQPLGLPRVVPSGVPPVPTPHSDSPPVVLKAEGLGLVIWIFEGLA